MLSMPQSSVPSQASSDPDEVVVGVDTHKDVHVAAVLTALGVLRETKTFPATAAGYQALLAWVGGFGRHCCIERSAHPVSSCRTSRRGLTGLQMSALCRFPEVPEGFRLSLRCTARAPFASMQQCPAAYPG